VRNRASTRSREFDPAAYAGPCYALDYPTHYWTCPACGARVGQRKDDPVGSAQVRAEHRRAWHGKGKGPAVVTVTPGSKARTDASRNDLLIRRWRSSRTAKQRRFVNNATGRGD